MMITIPRPATPDGQRRVHVAAAWIWSAFGVYGLVEYVLESTFGIKIFSVANSIPVLFAISVYANFVGHLSSAQAAQAEVKVDEAVSVDADHVSVENAESVEQCADANE